MGLPDVITFLLVVKVLGNVSNVNLDNILLILFAVPGTEFDSWTYIGTLMINAAMETGTVMYPPKPRTKIGFSRFIINKLWKIDLTVLTRPLIISHIRFPLTPEELIYIILYDSSLRIKFSIPDFVPIQVTLYPLWASFSEMFFAGITWPPVPVSYTHLTLPTKA